MLGMVEIWAEEIPARLKKVFPHLGEVWEEGGGPIEGEFGICFEDPLSPDEIASLDAAQAAGEIARYEYTPPLVGL